MAFKLKIGKSLGDQLHDIIKDQADKIINILSQSILGREETIHETRRRIKKIRSTLKLARGGMASEVYHQTNGACRDIARLCNQVRDADVLLETFHNLEQGVLKKVRSTSIEPVAHYLRKYHAEILRRALEDEKGIDVVLRQLEELSLSLGHLIIQGDGWALIGEGFQHTYQQGRDRFDNAFVLPSSTRMHDWRKLTRYLSFQLKLIRHIHPTIHAFFKEADFLGKVLGGLHDLDNFHQFMMLTSPSVLDGQTKIIMENLLEIQREKLQKKALELGKKFYALKPVHFEKSLKSLWNLKRGE